MNTNLLSNKELEDYTSEDSFDFLIKADAIKAFLEFNSTALEKNKMIVLYGDWGSGKTSLMKHIESTIDKNIYYPIFFHAWEHEKDENLPLSLCDALINTLESNNEIIKGFMKGAVTTLKSFTSGITLKSSGVLSGLGVDFEFSGEKVINAIDKASEKPEKLSFYKSNKEFKENFRKVEDLILKKHDAQKILIFVDDLDRCEPENVLNLITALKLFFTFGNKTVYFSGIDKDAVTKAVRTRYKDVIKSEEYMEKVFDISFNMPKNFDLYNFLKPTFYNNIIRDNNAKTYKSTTIINDFFKSIDFVNPRHVKKVLNKYNILKAFKTSNITGVYYNLIPDIIITPNSGKIFETIICLYAIILHEYNYEEFQEVVDYNHKILQFSEIRFAIQSKQGSTITKESAAKNVYSNCMIKEPSKATFSFILNKSNTPGTEPVGFAKFLYIFSNSQPVDFEILTDSTVENFNQLFTDKSFATTFCKFLIKYRDPLTVEMADSEYNLFNVFDMVKYLL